jgi:hypothetical protein
VSIRFASAGVLLLALLLPAQSVLAGPAGNATWGWVTARKPTTAMYTPVARDQGNSTGMSDFVEHLGNGDYRVTFPDLDNGTVTAGIPIVTALASSPRYCSPLDWGINSMTLDARTIMRCFGFDGEAVDSQFSTVYVRGGANSVTSAYLFAGSPTTTDYTPDPSYNFNTSGVANAIHRLGTGQYEAHLPHMADSGNIQVSATGDATCKLGGRHAGTNELIANVNCYAPDGDAMNASFTLLYMNHVGPTTVLRPRAAYLFANKSTTGTYTPNSSFAYSSTDMSLTVRRSGLGRYTATLSGMPKGGAAFVTAVGTDKARCQLTSIRTDGTPQKVGIACFKPNGSAVDSKFMLAWTK